MIYPPDPNAAPSKVSIHKHDFFDPERAGRKVPVKFIYPQNPRERNLPVIIWSHGLGGTRDGAGFIGRYLAAAGYVVINVQHQGTDSVLWEGKPGHPWDNIRKARISRKATLQRFTDIPFLMDSLPQWAETYPDIGSIADWNRVGMSGHSFGAVTTQIMAGQRLGKRNRMYSLADKRFRAALAYSPSLTYNHREDPALLYGPISLPTLYMTGTQDNSPVGKGYDYSRRLNIYEHAQGPDQYAMILEGGDHMVFSGSRGQLGDNPKREQHEKIIRQIALVFWDAYLKDSKAARAWLIEAASDYLGSEAEFIYKNIE